MARPDTFWVRGIAAYISSWNMARPGTCLGLQYLSLHLQLEHGKDFHLLGLQYLSLHLQLKHGKTWHLLGLQYLSLHLQLGYGRWLSAKARRH
jgi:hypothetical protein